MFRKDFIKRALGFAGLALLPVNKLMPPKKTWLLQFHIRGFQYYEGPGFVHGMNPGELLTLVREPKNKYDKNAIALHYHNRKIGFVPAEKNELISRILDSGTTIIKAEIIHTDPDAGSWDAVFAGIYMEREISMAA